jgi:hypothetical protein
MRNGNETAGHAVNVLEKGLCVSIVDIKNYTIPTALA